MQKLHVVFAVDRAGLVGEDGETHHGLFDIGFLRHAPGMTVLCPGSLAELKDMLRWAVEEQNGPVAIRYPRGGDRDYNVSAWVNSATVIKDGAMVCHRTGKDAAIVTYGTMLQNAMDAAELLSQRGIETAVLRLQTVSPAPIKGILEHITEISHLFVLEETLAPCGICNALSYELHARRPDIQVHGINLGEEYVTHGTVEKLYSHYHVDADAVAAMIEEVHQYEK